MPAPISAVMAAVAAIFMYHHVSVAVQPGPYARALTVTPQEFASQLQWLSDRGCVTRTVDAMVRDLRLGHQRSCEVALTFDDAYADAATVVAPLLEEYSDTATLYVPSGFLGRFGHLSAPQARHLARAGIEIGAHTINHPDLTLLPASQVTRQLRASKAALERAIGEPVVTMAYPAGRYDNRVEDEARAAGYRDAVSSDAGDLSAAVVATRAFALPRFRVLRDRGAALFASVLGAAKTAIPAPGDNARQLRVIARERSEGNDIGVAERIAVALLARRLPVQILKVRVERVGPAKVAGIMLSGVKFHRDVNGFEFESIVAAMIDRAFSAEQELAEVDVWAVVPHPPGPGATVSGDYAVSAERTVFSAAVARREWRPAAWPPQLGKIYWDQQWLTTLNDR